MKAPRCGRLRGVSWCSAAWLLLSRTALVVAADLDAAVVGRWPGVGGGWLNDIAVSGDYAYIAEGGPYSPSGVLVFDVSNPASARPVGAWRTTASDCVSVAASRHHVYVGQRIVGQTPRGRFSVVDVSDPVYPREVGGFDTEGEVANLLVSGHYAYVAEFEMNSRRGVLRVIDVHDPTKPQTLGRHVVSGGASGVALAGHYACLAIPGFYDGDNWAGGGLEVIDVTDPSNLQRVGCYVTSGWSVKSAAVSGEVAYLVEQIDPAHNPPTGYALRVVDISVPSAPRLVLSRDLEDGQAKVAVSGPYAYVYGGRLSVFDILNPAEPRLVGERPSNSWGIVGLAFSGSHAYAAESAMTWFTLGRDGRLEVFDASDSSHLRTVGVCYSHLTPRAVAVAGSYAYLLGVGLHICDVSNPAQPKHLGSVDTGPWAVNGDLILSGKYAYALSDALRVIDVSDPAKPRPVGLYRPEQNMQRVEVSGDKACLAGSGVGLEVLDIADPSRPRRIGGYSIPYGYCPGLALLGHYVCVTSFQSDLRASLSVLDLADPTAPRSVGGLSAMPFRNYPTMLSGRQPRATT